MSFTLLGILQSQAAGGAVLPALLTTATISGTGLDYGVPASYDQNLYLATSYSQANPRDAVVIAFDGDGNKQWSKQLGDPNVNNSDIYIDATTDSAGNFLGLMRLATDTFGSIDAGISKYNSSGNLSWVRKYGRSGGDSPGNIRTDDSANVYFSTNEQFDADAVIVKLNSSGAKQWDKKLSITTNQAFMTLDNSGNIIGSATNNVTDCVIFKIDPSGNLVWQRQVAHNQNLSLTATDSSGNIYLALPEDYSFGLRVYKISSSGTQLASKRFPNLKNRNQLGLTVTLDDELIVNSPDALFRLDANLNVVWARTVTWGDRLATRNDNGAIMLGGGVDAFTTNGEARLAQLDPSGNAFPETTVSTSTASQNLTTSSFSFGNAGYDFGTPSLFSRDITVSTSTTPL